MNPFSLILTFSLLCTGLQSLNAENEEDSKWSFVRERKLVKKYINRKSEDLTAFRGVGIIDGTPEKLVGIIHNPERWKFWIDDLENGKLIEKKSEFHFICKQEIDALWPVKNREVVFESKISREGPSQIILNMKSVTDPNAPLGSGKCSSLGNSLRYTIDPMEGKLGYESNFLKTFQILVERFPNSWSIGLPNPFLYRSLRD